VQENQSPSSEKSEQKPLNNVAKFFYGISGIAICCTIVDLILLLGQILNTSLGSGWDQQATASLGWHGLAWVGLLFITFFLLVLSIAAEGIDETAVETDYHDPSKPVVRLVKAPETDKMVN